jgi:hypothetical protein
MSYSRKNSDVLNQNYYIQQLSKENSAGAGSLPDILLQKLPT